MDVEVWMLRHVAWGYGTWAVMWQKCEARGRSTCERRHKPLELRSYESLFTKFSMERLKAPEGMGGFPSAFACDGLDGI